MCAAYLDFLLRTAATAEFVEVLAALLPCMWGYSELGRTLAAAGLPTTPATDAGSRPTPTRSSPGWPPGARPCWAARPTGCRRRLAACERAFLTSLRHELAFWDAWS